MESRQLNNNYQSYNLPNMNMKVVSFRRYVKTRRSKAVFVIAMCQLIVWLIYFRLNVTNYAQYSLSESLMQVSFLSKMFTAFTQVVSRYSFMWFSVSSLLGFVGLMNMKSWGWVIALITNSLYVSMITANYMQESPNKLLVSNYFLVFLILFTIASTIYLWVKRFSFWKK